MEIYLTCSQCHGVNQSRGGLINAFSDLHQITVHGRDRLAAAFREGNREIGK